MEYNHRNPDEVRAAIIDEAGAVYRLDLSGELTEEFFEDWNKDHWIGISQAAEDVKNGRAVEAKENAEAVFGSIFSISDDINYAAGRYLYLISTDKVRAKLEGFVPQEVRDMFS